MLKGLPSAGTSQKSKKRLKFSKRGWGGCRRRRRRMGADVKKGKKGEVLPRSTA